MYIITNLISLIYEFSNKIDENIKNNKIIKYKVIYKE